MPQISYFFGIVIFMYYSEHNPPHIHAVYSGYKASFDVRSGCRVTGQMSKTAERLIKRWIKLRKSALLNNWELARKRVTPLPAVEPLE